MPLDVSGRAAFPHSVLGKFIWLDASSAQLPQPGRGTVMFQAKAQNDITLALSCADNTNSTVGARDARAAVCYEVNIGGYLNRRSVIRCRSEVVAQVSKHERATAAIPNAREFHDYWVSVCDGHVVLGTGKLAGRNVLLSWKDPSPKPVSRIALGSWNVPVVYRAIFISDGIAVPEDNRLLHGHANFAQFLETGVLSDVAISFYGIAGLVYRVHSVILSAWSLRFFDLIRERDSAKSDIRLDPAHFDPTILGHLLYYLYNGNVGSFDLSNDRSVEALAAMASFFHIESLATPAAVRAAAADSSPPKKAVSFRHLLTPFLANPWADAAADGGAGSLHPPPDLCLDLDDGFVRAHRVVLTAWSPPLAAMFTNEFLESRSGRVRLFGVTKATALALLAFCYSGEDPVDVIDEFRPPSICDEPPALDSTTDSVTMALSCSPASDSGMTDDEIEAGRLTETHFVVPLVELLELAHRLCIPKLVELCANRLIEELDAENCCSILLLSHVLGRHELKRAALLKTAQSFSTVTSKDPAEFVRLPADCVRDLLQQDELDVSSEAVVLDALILWTREDPADRFDDFKALLDVIRLPSLGAAERDAVLCQAQAAFTQTPSFAARLSQLANEPEREAESSEPAGFEVVDGQIRFDAQLANRRLARSQTGSQVDLVYVSEGDENGLFYFLGTDCGRHKAWVNPFQSSAVRISMSSSLPQGSKTEWLVDRNTHMSMRLNGQGSWITFDIGPSLRFSCKGYLLRHDGYSTGYLRTWSFEASDDDYNWTQLDTRIGDRTTCRPNQFAYFETSSRSKTPHQAYRYFRLRILSGTVLALQQLELYGAAIVT